MLCAVRCRLSFPSAGPHAIANFVALSSTVEVCKPLHDLTSRIASLPRLFFRPLYYVIVFVCPCLCVTNSDYS